MRKISMLCLTLLVFATAQSQEKTYTLHQAVLEQGKALYPNRMHDIQWVNGNFFSVLNYEKKGEIDILSAENGDSIQNISIEDIQWPKDIEVKSLQGIKWEDSLHFRMLKDHTVLLVNKKDKSVKIMLSDIDTLAENQDYNTAQKALAYTKKNNLYLQNENGMLAITNNKDSNIVSGQAIHRFEFGIKKGTFWSPKGEKLAYYQKDESKVADYPLLDITTTPGSLKSIKYPMAGQPSEIGNVLVYSLKTKKNIKLEKQGGAEDYVTNVSWTPKGDQLIVAEVNRGQNEMHLNLFDAESGTFLRTLYEEKNDKWVEPEHQAFFVNDETFIWMSEKDGFMNLYKIPLKGGKIKQITKNKWVAKSIIEKSEDVVYFYGTGKSPLDKKVFAVNWKTKEQWAVTAESGTHNVNASPNKKFFIDQWSSHEVPQQVDLLSAKGKTIGNLLQSEDPLKEYQQAKVEIGNIKAADDKTELYYRMIKPYNFDANKKYPALVYVYGGPHAQMVTNKYRDGAPLWMHWMANQGYIIFTVDGRGSASRGFEFESIIHRHLGDHELKDQLKGVAFLKKKTFVDTNKLAVHGWSYGGFMTTSLMLRYPNTFKVAVAGGPVTDWKWYEVMYGERYMDQPTENPEGYQKARVMNYVDSLKGDLLLIHGTIDDVVVMQHNLALVKAFVSAEKQVDFFPYPMHKHNVLGKDRVHLMRKVLTYIQEHLGEEALGE